MTRSVRRLAAKRLGLGERRGLGGTSMKWISTAAMALACMLGASACGGEAKSTQGGQEVVTVTVTTEEATTNDTTTDEFEDAPEAGTTTEDTAASDQVPIGRSAEDDGVSFKVTKLAKVSSLARAYNSPIRPRSGADLWAATIQFKNNTDRGVDPFCGGSSAILIDYDQRNFDPHQDSISIKGNDVGYCGENLQPGFRATVTLGFMVPSDTIIAGIAVWNGDLNNDDSLGETYVVFSRS
jgi:hypothetical protein